MTQTVLGGGILLAVGTALIQAVAPAPPPPPAIVINSLEYDDGFIIQDRTINSVGKFTAAWTASIMAADTGKAVCSGGGLWPYSPGVKRVRITLSEWTGDATCLSLPPGRYYPFATYQGGEFYADFRGDVFEVME